MRFRWIALGVVGFAVWLVATFGVVYAAVELAEDERQGAEDQACSQAVAYFSALNEAVPLFQPPRGEVVAPNDISVDVFNDWNFARRQINEACSTQGRGG